MAAPRSGTPEAEAVERLPTAGLSRSVAFSPDGQLLAVGQFDGDGQLYSTDTWAPTGRRLEAHTQRITNVEFSRDGRTLATSSADGTVQLWDVATQEPLGCRCRSSPTRSLPAAFSPDGTRLFAVSTASLASASRRSGGMEAPRLLRRWARAE